MTRNELEARLEAHLFARVRALGGRTFKLVPVVAGMPDRLVLFPGGVVYWCELKTRDGRLSDIQQHQHGLLRALGVDVHVLYGREQIDGWLQWTVDDRNKRERAEAALRGKMRMLRD